MRFLISFAVAVAAILVGCMNFLRINAATEPRFGSWAMDYGLFCGLPILAGIATVVVTDLWPPFSSLRASRDVASGDTEGEAVVTNRISGPGFSVTITVDAASIGDAAFQGAVVEAVAKALAVPTPGKGVPR